MSLFLPMSDNSCSQLMFSFLIVPTLNKLFLSYLILSLPWATGNCLWRQDFQYQVAWKEALKLLIFLIIEIISDLICNKANFHLRKSGMNLVLRSLNFFQDVVKPWICADSLPVTWVRKFFDECVKLQDTIGKGKFVTNVSPSRENFLPIFLHVSDFMKFITMTS